MFEELDRVKPALKKLIGALRKEYPYASVLAVMDDWRSWSVSSSGVSISSGGIGGGDGYVVRVFDETGCCEYSFNAFSEEDIPAICETLRTRMAERKATFPESITPLPTAIPADEPCVLKKETSYRIHPREMGDEAIIARLKAARERGMKTDGVLDVRCTMSYRSYRKIFLSEHRDLDQSCLYTCCTSSGLAAKNEEIKMYYLPHSVLGGAELLDSAEKDAETAAQSVLELLDAVPLPPGEYECICTPEVTGMIVHEAFGHGVEEDMFVKDRALARRYMGKRVASDLVTMVDGPTGDQTATMFFDDEGTLTGDTLVIDKGILVSGYADVLSASRLGVKATGNGRRESYERKAYTRMTNTYFKGGTDSVEDMIASVKDGLLLEMPSSGMEDPKNWGIQCMVDFAREIKDGKLTGRIFSPIVLSGYVPDLLQSISMMSPNAELCGTGFCGKGHKEYVVVSDGGPYIKARIQLG